jgi:hypothetical protein
LIFVLSRKSPRAFQIFWRSVDNVLDARKRIFQAFLYEGNCQVGNVYPDPLSPKFLGSMDGRPASAEWIKNNIALVGTGVYDALQQSQWFLCWIAEPL